MPNDQASAPGDIEPDFEEILDPTAARNAVQLAKYFGYELEHWEETAGRLFVTNHSSFVAFLEDVYGSVPTAGDGKFHGGDDPDEVLKDELRELPSVLHRVVIEAVYGLWYLPIPKSLVAAAMDMSEEALEQILTTAVSSHREREEQFIHQLQNTQW